MTPESPVPGVSPNPPETAARRRRPLFEVLADYEDDQGAVTYCHRECVGNAVRRQLARELRAWVADSEHSAWREGVRDAASRLELGR